jgi:predicted ATPase/DNA-binding SARP family transcriptional activator
MEFRILGPLEVSDEGGAVSLGGRKPRTLLAVLLLQANEVVPADRLIDELWGEDSPEHAADALRVNVSRLRKALPQDVLTTRSPGYLVRVEPEQLDLHRFERLVDEGRSLLARGLAAEASERLHEALSLWRGPPLADFAYENFAQTAIGRLEEIRLAAVELRIEADLALGRHDELVGELETLIAEHPLREHLRMYLMTALYRSGRQAEALDAYQDARRVLVDELGIEPRAALQELERAILRHDPALDVSPKTISTTNLPRPASSFVGRKQELAELLSRIEGEARLITLTGAGGSGKTRLALEAAASLVPSYTAGVFWVGLAALRDAALVTETISQTLGAKDGLAGHIGEREMLVLVDNLEQVIDAAPELSELLSACPNLTLLVTSRELLRVAGEVEYPVPPLAEPEAVDLFCERSHLEPTDQIAELCARLDDLPLGIELAAARTKALSPAQILERLSQRLDFLRGGRDADPRQQTLRATMEWSHDLLTAEEQQLFRRLSVFAGGCTLEAADEVCEANPDTLQSLVEKSLVRHEGERFTMLETIRDFARERLEASDGADRLLEAHARYYAALGECLHGAPFGKRAELAARLEADVDNFRAALSGPFDDPELKLRLATQLTPVWDIHGRALEGRGWIEVALVAAPAAPPHLRALALHRMGVLALYSDHVDDGEPAVEQSLELFRALGEELDAAIAQQDLGFAAWCRGDSARARALYEESREAFIRLGNEGWQAGAAHYLGELEVREGDLERGEALLRESLTFYRRVGAHGAVANALHSLGDAALRRSSFEEAAFCYREGLEIATDVHLERSVVYGLAGLAAVAAGQGRETRAGLLWGAVEQLEHRLESRLVARERAPYERVIERYAEDVAFNAALRKGRTIPLEETVENALSLD